MEQLWIKADQFRKQGRLQDQDLEEIIKEIKEGEELKVGDVNSAQKQRQRMSTDKSSKQSKKAYCKCTGQPLTQSSKGSFESWGKTATASTI